MAPPGNIPYLYVMQRLTTLLLLAGVTFTAQAQIVDDYQPDSDGDGCVGMSDLLSLLSVFGSCETQAFACGDPINYQGYDYATVLIGEQCWFAENLRNELYLNGDSILANLSESDWSSTTSGAVAVYGEGSSSCQDQIPDDDACNEAWSLNEYGRLYNWYAVDDARGLCPSGWHVPSDGEWLTMEMALGMSEWESNAGGWRGTDQSTQMRADYGWPYGSNGTNSSGFSALPGGGYIIYSSSLGHWHAGIISRWWTSTSEPESPGYKSFHRALHYGLGSVNRDYSDWHYGLSVRCIQDSE